MSSSKGFNPISKYRRADYVCLANHEVDIETRQRGGDDRSKLQEVAGRIACPRCTAVMQALQLPSHRPLPVTVDHCAGCRLVWFDELESVQLDGMGWTRLLREPPR